MQQFQVNSETTVLGFLNATEVFSYGDNSTIALATTTVTLVNNQAVVAIRADTAGVLSTLNGGGAVGDIIILKLSTPGSDVTVTATGNIQGPDCVLADHNDSVMLLNVNGTHWVQLACSTR